MLLISASLDERPDIISGKTEIDFKNRITKFYDGIVLKIKHGKICADSAVYYENEKKVSFNGSIKAEIKIEQEEITIAANSGHYDFDLGEAHLKGKVMVESKEFVVYGDSAKYDDQKKEILFEKIENPPQFIYQGKYFFTANTIIVKIDERKVSMKGNVKGKLKI